LFTIVVMFSPKGKVIIEEPLDVLLVAVPLVLHFLLMWFAAFFLARRLGGGYGRTTAVPVLVFLVNVALGLRRRLFASIHGPAAAAAR